MTTPVPGSKSTSMRERLGLPVVTGRKHYVTSTIIDSLANGLVFAFLMVYFERVTVVGLGAIGVAMSLGRLLALPAPLIVGPLMDRIGSKKVVVAGNVVSCAGMIVCAVATDAWHIVVAQLLVQSGINAYWTCSRELVSIASNGEQRSRWFGMQNALRNIGSGFGAAVTAGALVVLGSTGLRSVVLVSAISFLIAGALLLAWRADTGPRVREDEDNEEIAVSYLTVVRDTRYLTLLLVNLVFVLAAMVLPVLIAIWTIDYVGVSAWWSGALVVLNTAMVALLSTVAVSWTETWKKHRLLQATLALNAVSFGLFVFADGRPEVMAVVVLTAAMIAYTLAEVLGTPHMNELAVTLAPSIGAGRYHAAFQVSWSVGMAIAPALFSALLTAGSALPWIFLCAVSLLTIPVAQRLRPAA